LTIRIAEIIRITAQSVKLLHRRRSVLFLEPQRKFRIADLNFSSHKYY